jgi:hypothetical protein
MPEEKLASVKKENGELKGIFVSTFEILNLSFILYRLSFCLYPFSRASCVPDFILYPFALILFTLPSPLSSPKCRSLPFSDHEHDHGLSPDPNPAHGFFFAIILFKTVLDP